MESNQKFPYPDSRTIADKPAFKCIHECCKRLRKSDMFQLGHLMDSVTLVGSNAIPSFKYNGVDEVENDYRFCSEWTSKSDEPLDLSIHKMVRS